jgi:predicted extracellular nuclease
MPEYFLAFWNVENLFHTESFSGRSDKLQRAIGADLTGWTAARLKRKIGQLAKIIRHDNFNGGEGPDLLGVCEVENEVVLQKLVDKIKEWPGKAARNYRVVHENTNDRRGIDIAFIYDADRFEIERISVANSAKTRNAVFSHALQKRTATRDLLQANFLLKTGGEKLVIIGNHWPARVGGQYASEPYRMMAGETLAYFHERIRQLNGENVALLALGDFNDEPFDRSLRQYALAVRERGMVTRARSPKLLNLMWDLMGDGVASHYYGSTPNMLDQILVSKGILTGNSGLKIVEDSVEVFRPKIMRTSTQNPTPRRYGGMGKEIDKDGFSDHYPIAVKISS